jgi:hypothetical protein
MMKQDEPRATLPSPRTTIVGGRPPEGEENLPPVPTGMQQLLRLAAVEPRFRQQLLKRRSAVAQAAQVRLTRSEQAILTAVEEKQLRTMVDNMPPPTASRRDLLRNSALSAVLLLGGAGTAGSVTACHQDQVRRDDHHLIQAGQQFVEPPEPPLENPDAGSPADNPDEEQPDAATTPPERNDNRPLPNAGQPALLPPPKKQGIINFGQSVVVPERKRTIR